jgi:hypothetical protein
MSKETLEQAAKQYAKLSTVWHAEPVFIDGAKWQQEQDSGKDTADYIDKNLVQALVEIAKQNPTVYSEEDLIDFAHFYFKEEFNSTMQTSKSTKDIFNKWFEQFKKTK